MLTLYSSRGVSSSVEIVPHETVILPLLIERGSQIMTMTLESLATEEPGIAQPTEFGIAAINLKLPEQNLPTTDLRVNGQIQPAVPDRFADQMIALHGPGWYDPEAPTWRWARSPAEVLVYSPLAQVVQLEMVPVFLNNPASPGETAQDGIMQLKVKGGSTSALKLDIEQPAVTELNLKPGWNTLVFNLESGNFNPSETQAGSTDSRSLSFVLSRLEIRSMPGQ